MRKMKTIGIRGLIAAGTIAGIMAFTGCSASYSLESSTNTVTDLNGVKHSTTVVTKTENGHKTTTKTVTDSGKTAKGDATSMTKQAPAQKSQKGHYENVPVSVVNASDDDIVEIYISDSTSDSWGDNLLKNGYVLEDGDEADGVTISFDENTTFDIKVVEEDNEVFEYNGIEMKDINENGVIFTFKGETVNVRPAEGPVNVTTSAPVNSSVNAIFV